MCRGYTFGHKQIFDGLGFKLGYNRLDDWYNISPEEITKNGGDTVLRTYGGSIVETLQTLYPKHSWLPWRFNTLPPDYWKSKANQRDFFEWLSKQLGHKGLDDWYKVSRDEILRQGGRGVLTEHNNLVLRAL